MNCDRTCAGIVSYNSDICKLKRNIEHIKNQVDKVIVCDNGSSNINEIRHLIAEKPSKVELIGFDENRGIAAALNRICKLAMEEGYTWILTLDQDSECPKDLIVALKVHVSKTTAIVAPRIVYRNNEQYAGKDEQKIEEVSWVITSASLTNLKVWQDIGGFDEDLFMDRVDYDFCIRAGQAGYKILKVNEVALLHELGELRCRKFFGRTIYVTNHSAIRRYYSVRNIIYLRRKLHVRNHPWAVILKNLIKIILFEDNKWKNIKEMNRGIKDGLKWAHKKDNRPFFDL